MHTCSSIMNASFVPKRQNKINDLWAASCNHLQPLFPSNLTPVRSISKHSERY